MIADVVDVAFAMSRALEAVGANYYIGGSVASSLQATSRTTNDIDFVVELRRDQVDALAAELGPDFSVDTEALKDAVARRWSWNVFHLPSGLKIDLMMRQPTPYDTTAFARRKRFRIDVDVEPFVKSVEDSILKKLQWFQAGGESSSTQWRDVVELIRVNAVDLQDDYLETWAPQLGIADLLVRARQEASSPR